MSACAASNLGSRLLDCGVTAVKMKARHDRVLRGRGCSRCRILSIALAKLAIAALGSHAQGLAKGPKRLQLKELRVHGWMGWRVVFVCAPEVPEQKTDSMLIEENSASPPFEVASWGSALHDAHHQGLARTHVRGFASRGPSEAG